MYIAAGKPDKLKNLRTANMWYLTEKCSPLSDLLPRGNVYKQVSRWPETANMSVRT
jgi:hypothetical protein